MLSMLCVIALLPQDLEQADVAAGAEDADDKSGRGKQNRSEKKARKAMQKLGMKPVSGISRVTVKKAKNVRFLHVIPS